MLQPPLPCYFSYFTCSCRSDDATRMMGLLAGRLTLLDILEILGDEEAGVSSTTTGLRSNWAASRIHGSWARFRTDMLGFDVHSIAFGFVRVGSTPDRSLS